MSVYNIYPTGTPCHNPTLYTNNGDYGWTSISDITDYQMPIHSWTLKQGFGKVLAKLKNYINLHNLGTQSIPIGTGYYSTLGTSGTANWWTLSIGSGINTIYVKNLHISGDYKYHNAHGASLGTIADSIIVKSSSSPLIGASSYINDIDATDINSSIDSSGHFFASNISDKNRTNAEEHIHKNIITLAGMSGALGYFLPKKYQDYNIYLQELNLQSGRFEFSSDSEIVVNNGIYIYQSGKFYLPESCYDFESTPKHRHDNVSGKILTSTSIGTILNTEYNSGIYSGLTIYNEVGITGIIKGNYIISDDWDTLWTYNATMPSIYSFNNNLLFSKDYTIYKSIDLGITWGNPIYESPSLVTHNNLTDPSKNQNKFRIMNNPNKLWLGRSGEIINTTDLSNWTQSSIKSSGFNDGIIYKNIVFFAVEDANPIYYSGEWIDVTGIDLESHFIYKGNLLYIKENIYPIKYKQSWYTNTSGRLYEFTDINENLSTSIYDTTNNDCTRGPMKIYADKLYFGIGSGLYSYYNNYITIEKNVSSIINDMHVFSGYLYIACATGLYRYKGIIS